MSSIERYFRAQQDPRTPPDELVDVNRELLRGYISGVSNGDLIGNDEMASWMGDYHSQYGADFAKAKVLQPSWYEAAVPHPEEPGHKTILRVNDLGIVGAGPIEKWDEKPFGRGFEFLKFMGDNLDLHQAVTLTLIKQVVPYLRRYRDNDQNPLGYDWIRTDQEDLTDDDRKEVLYLDQVLQNSGTEFDAAKRQKMGRRSLTGFVSALLHDSLTGDACPIECERSNSGKLIGWYAMPFDTVRLARETGYLGDDSIVAVQVIQQQGIVGLTAEDIIYEVRNPRATLEYNGYGMSELESFIRLSSSYINTCVFNAASLDRNSIPRGILTLYGRFNRKSLNFFNQQMSALMRGAGKRFGLPVLVSESRNEGGASWTPVDMKDAEMMMTKWLVFIVSMYCALHGASPEIVNLESFSAKTSGLSSKSDTEERLQSGHNKGFVPRMKWLFDDLLNARIVAQLTSKYRITPVGLFPDNELQRHERQKLSMSADEIRAIDGQEPWADPDIGGAPVENPGLMTIYSMKLQAKLGQQQGGSGQDFGLPDSESPLPYGREGDQDEGKPGAQGAAAGGGGKVVPFRQPGVPAQRPQAAGAPMAKARTGSLDKFRIEISDVRGRVRIDDEEEAV